MPDVPRPRPGSETNEGRTCSSWSDPCSSRSHRSATWPFIDLVLFCVPSSVASLALFTRCANRRCASTISLLATSLYALLHRDIATQNTASSKRRLCGLPLPMARAPRKAAARTGRHAPTQPTLPSRHGPHGPPARVATANPATPPDAGCNQPARRRYCPRKAEVARPTRCTRGAASCAFLGGVGGHRADLADPRRSRALPPQKEAMLR